MSKRSLIAFIFFFIFSFVRADEGMWLLQFLGESTYQEMVKKGLKLSREQLYSLNKSSLKDAIVIFAGGCTGEMVSAEGLLFTNHHCGYGAIAAASTVENNYLRDGFWAKDRASEIPAPSVFVQFLRRIEDVTPEVETALTGLEGASRAAKLQSVSSEISKRIKGDTNLEVRVVPFFRNNQYLAFIYERYSDVRLVGAPAESIGKFGGDTDNWEWPRHTGDFSVFRVYAAKDGKPASYSAENVPLKPAHFLPVSTKGVKDGDYSMILGYPGGTNRYETSFGVKLKTEIENPAIVNLRDVRLKLMFEEMKKSDAVRLQLASNYASVANYWKFFDGERKQLLKYDVYGKKLAEESRFKTWAAGKTEFDGLFEKFDAAYKAWWPYARHRIYINEGILGSPLAAYAISLQGLERALTRKPVNPDDVKKAAEAASRGRQAFLEGANKASDEKILAATCQMFWQDVDPSQHPEGFFEGLKTYGSLEDGTAFRSLAREIFSGTILLDDKRWNDFAAAPDSLTLQKDPAYRYATTFVRNYLIYQPKSVEFTNQNNDLSRIYMKGILQINAGNAFYPDANFTMRMSYGQVKSYKPRDGVSYDYICTMSGVMEKYKPGDYEFDLPKNLVEAVKKKDFGAYADPKRGDLVVGFITTNDITGGNSGSPVVNGKGELIGLAFDGNYEALSHKIAFDKDLNRTICVDIRYVLWCIEKLGGARHLINELTLR
ncbi:MAG: S46 family peptidase [Cyclobacteriaceae bacterium]